MPIYEYECTECGKHIEVTQKISDPPLLECKLCRGRLKRLIAATSFVLKGSGWYVTDYPSADRKKAIEAKKSLETKKDAKSESKNIGTDSRKEGALKS